MKLSTMRLTASWLAWALPGLASPSALAAGWGDARADDRVVPGLFDQETFSIDRNSSAREGEPCKVWTMLDIRQPMAPDPVVATMTGAVCGA